MCMVSWDPTCPLLLPTSTCTQAKSPQQRLQDTGEDWGFRNTEAECPTDPTGVGVPTTPTDT